MAISTRMTQTGHSLDRRVARGVTRGEPLEPQNVIGRPTEVTRARRWIFAALFLLAGIVLVTWATRAAWLAFSDYEDFWAGQELCEGTSRDVGAQIAACTRQIGSGHFWGHDLAIEHYNRGIAWGAKGDYDRAIADYDQAIRLDPKHTAAYVNRGAAWSDKGDHDRAIADYTEAIRLNPEDADPYVNRGVAWKAKGELDRAIADYDQALRLDAKDEHAYVNRGAAWFYKGDLDRAIADYTEAIRLDSANAYSLYGRGVAKLKKGDTAGGNADIAAAKAIKPDIAVVSAGYGITVDAAGANAAPEHK
jgi:tetratricopeptide (TPR) repeat protein